MTEYAVYFKYLKSRSRLGLLYRWIMLYPRLACQLSGRVLDVGCGIGDFVRFRSGTIGVDVNPYAVEWCRQHNLDCQLMEVDRLPFPGGSFEGVVLDNVLEHLKEPGLLLSEIHRVLVPGGRLLVGVPGERGYACDPDHKIFYGEADLARVMGGAGFSTRTVFHTPFKSRWLDAKLPQYCVYGVYERH